MDKTKKRAFTIVELVIVIAVIAILAAVLIALFMNLIKKANKSADMQLIRNLNTALTTDAILNGKHTTMQSALDAAEKNGYILEKINATATQSEIIWDSKNDMFCYLNDDGTIEYLPEANIKYARNTDDSTTYISDKVNDIDYFVISSTISDKYSTYLYNYTGASTLEITKGLDVGTVTSITNITYNGSDAGQTVIIRTNSSGITLTVNAPNDTVNHYDKAGKIVVNAVDPAHSYHEFGHVVYLKAVSGHFVFENGSYVDILYSVSSSGVSFEMKNGAKINHAHTSSEELKRILDGVSANIVWDYDADGTPTHPTGAWNPEEEAENIISQEITKELNEKEPDAEYVARIGLTGYTSFDDAWAAAKEMGTATVTLLKDATVSSSIEVPANASITLDLGGKALTNAVAGTKTGTATASKSILVNGNFSIKNGSYKTTGQNAYVLYVDNANLTVNINGVELSGTGASNRGIQVGINANNSTINFINSSLVSSNSGTSIHAFGISTNATVNVKNSEITSNVGAAFNIPAAGNVELLIDNSTIITNLYNLHAISMSGSGNIVIKNGSLIKNNTATGSGTAINVTSANANITISGDETKLYAVGGTKNALKMTNGTVTINSGIVTGAISKTGGTLNIYGGKFSADVSSYCTPAEDYDLTEKTTISDKEHTVVRYAKVPLILTDSRVDVELNGDSVDLPAISENFTGIPGEIVWTLPDGANDYITVSNGKVSAHAKSTEDIVLTATVGQSSCEVTVHIADYVCAIDDKKFESLDDAFDAAGVGNNGTTISLLKDFDLLKTAKAALAGKTITLDMAGYTISWTDSSVVSGDIPTMIDLVSGTLVITGNGTFKNDSSSLAKAIVFFYSSGTPKDKLDKLPADANVRAVVNIKNGTFDVNTSEVVYIGRGSAIIEGGTFKGVQNTDHSDYRFTVNCLDDEYSAGRAVAVISGGSFYGYNPEDGLSEGANTRFTPDGYHAEYNEETGYYTVVANN